jgi:enamine deaminase RidA (YjgF/YER057c/UK114 family)
MIEEKILALGIELPNAPRSAGSYVQVAITGNLVFVSGQIPVE